MGWVQVAVNAADVDHSFCKWIIAGLAGAFASVSFIAYNWIRALIKENKDERDERLADLKDHYKPFRKED